MDGCATIKADACGRHRPTCYICASFVEEGLVSLSTFSPNGHASPVTHAPFRAYLEAERPALIHALTREVLAQIPQYNTLANNAPEQRIDKNIGVYLASFDDPEALIAWTKQQFAEQMSEKVEFDTIFEISSMYRQQFLN